jgi:hypothetical protein
MEDLYEDPIMNKYKEHDFFPFVKNYLRNEYQYRLLDFVKDYDKDSYELFDKIIKDYNYKGTFAISENIDDFFRQRNKKRKNILLKILS